MSLNLNQWINKRFFALLACVGLVLIVSQMILFASVLRSFRQQQSEAIERFSAMSLAAISSHQLTTLNQLAAMTANTSKIKLILLCNNADEVTWSYPYSLKNCTIPPAKGNKVYEKAVFLGTAFPKLVFQFPDWPQTGTMIGSVFIVFVILASGFFFLWRIRYLMRQDIYFPLTQISQENATFKIKEFARINTELSALRNQEKQLVEAAAIGNMTSQVVHDLAGPLQSINAARECLQRIKHDDAYFQDSVALLERGCQRLSSVAEGLLKKKQEVQISTTQDEKQNFHLQELIQSLVHEYQLQNKVQSRDASLQIISQVPQQAIFLSGSTTRLQRALGNLIKNAIEAMHGKGKIVIQVDPSPIAQDDRVIVSITDNGPGMSESTLQKILQGGHTDGKSNGHGIGMKVVRETVEDFGGTLTARSELGKGTSFQIALPLLETPY